MCHGYRTQTYHHTFFGVIHIRVALYIPAPPIWSSFRYQAYFPKQKNMDYDLDVYPKLNIPNSLLQLLSNTLVLHQTAPYISIASLFALGATSKSFKDLIYNNPNVFRYLDLSYVKLAQPNKDAPSAAWLNAQNVDDITADKYISPTLEKLLTNISKLLLKPCKERPSQIRTAEHPSKCPDVSPGWARCTR